ncbi:MAG TPA: hypothetical protein VFH50_08255 [Acidimicrobiales bacterium]|nr:hypothetical protein [Acidimicrobiales bacterium]
MRCSRCGERDHQPGGQPEVRVDTVTVRVNETVELLRVSLCTLCRAVLSVAIEQALKPATRPAA